MGEELSKYFFGYMDFLKDNVDYYMGANNMHKLSSMKFSLKRISFISLVRIRFAL
jgi:hypothetical protein